MYAMHAWHAIIHVSHVHSYMYCILSMHACIAYIFHIPHYITLCHITSHHASLHRITLHRVASHSTMLNHMSSRYITLHYSICIYNAHIHAYVHTPHMHAYMFIYTQDSTPQRTTRHYTTLHNMASLRIAIHHARWRRTTPHHTCISVTLTYIRRTRIPYIASIRTCISDTHV